MLYFVNVVARSLALLITILSVFIVVPFIFNLYIPFMFILLPLTILVYSPLFYIQLEWFVKGDK